MNRRCLENLGRTRWTIESQSFLPTSFLTHCLSLLDPQPSDFRTACRCDDEANCLEQSLQSGAPLNLCIFARDGVSFLGVDTLNLIQGDLVETIDTTGNATGVLRQCSDQLCVVSTPMPPSLFGPGRPNFVNVEGIALATPASTVQSETRFLRGLQQGTDTVQYGFGTELTLGQDGSPLLDTFGTLDTHSNHHHDNGSGGVKLVAWLLPFLVIVLFSICWICLAYYRRDTGEAADEAEDVEESEDKDGAVDESEDTAEDEPKEGSEDGPEEDSDEAVEGSGGESEGGSDDEPELDV